MVLLNNKDYSTKYLKNKVIYIKVVDECQYCPYKEFCGVIDNVMVWGENNEILEFLI